MNILRRIESGLDTIVSSVMEHERKLTQMEESGGGWSLSLSSLGEKLDVIESKLSRRHQGRGRRRSQG